MMLKLLHGALSTVAILIAAYLIPGVQTTLLAALLLAIVLGAINISIKPIIKFITLPINILTLGLFSIFLNAAFVLLAASLVHDYGFILPNLWTAIEFSLVLSFLNGIFHFGLPR
jgi:putative membrane protein